METKLSSWTPLNHPVSNSKVFAERRILLSKWFDRWSDGQRKALLQDLVLRCSMDQLRFLSLSVSRQLPLQAADFTCLLPRALSLFIFSFLDPRSLCRCSQVSWIWRSMVELDQLWRPRCVRLGWSIGFTPTPFEQGVWKRLYVQKVQEIRITSLQQQFVLPDVAAVQSEEPPDEFFTSEEPPESTNQRPGSSSRSGLKKEKQLPPWRDSDRRPKDTIRFNYLDNLEPVQLRAQMKSRVKPDDVEKRKTLSEANYKLRKAKSLMFLSSNCKPHHLPSPPHLQTQTRPLWASPPPDHPLTQQTSSSLLRLAQFNAGIRPRPVRTPVPQLSVEALRASQRSHRSVPSTPLFDFQPWTASTLHKQEKK
ncbi:F-box only protein 16 isoform X1 [Amphiprion ocellaris]|uniref:F-box only protein 16 isoform X1 n=1 Tax=Amphiprion ocellaris TaxID=80972 RepID=UPI001649AD5E|nr:F-box only protein 16 isoform X1 [Amphiprion ocellaris]XP_054871846.1 F-box only protein 16 isoform X1 [Amphiprion ocellaris]